MLKRTNVSIIGAAAILLSCTTTSTVSYSQNYMLIPVIKELSLPVKGVFQLDDDNHMYVVEKEGRIIKAKVGGDEKFRSLDIRERVYSTASETGLLGLAFHPNYKENGRLFVNYTTMKRNHLTTRISEFSRITANTFDPQSEKILLEIDQPYANHNGGEIAFGPDGCLYIGMGDGGSAGDPQNRAQNLDSLLGKMLRIDVDQSIGGKSYSIPADNPIFANRKVANEVFAYGLRNPWRFSFDRVLGTLWTGDVGQNRKEEIDVIVAGGNYGWRIMEGTLCHSPSINCSQENLKRPVYEYGRTEGLSITGGYVYRGSALPELEGKYIYGDFGSGNIWALSFDTRDYRATGNLLLLESSMQVSAFAENNRGEIFVLNYGSGTIYRLEK